VKGEFTIIFEPCEEGGFTAYIPEVPGAVSEGETIEEAREMVRDALREITTYRRSSAWDRACSRALTEFPLDGFVPIE